MEKAALAAGMAGNATPLLDRQKQDVTITVGANRSHPLHVAGGMSS